MGLRKERNIRKTQKKTMQAKKKSFSRTLSRKRRTESSKTVLYNQATATVSLGNPIRYDRIWE